MLILALIHIYFLFLLYWLDKKDGEYFSGHEVFLSGVALAYNNFTESTERTC